MTSTGRIWLGAAAVFAVIAAGCGGDDAGDDSVPEPPAEGSVGDAGLAAGEAETTEPPNDVAESDSTVDAADDTADGDFPIPVAKYTAHGPDAATTVAPQCGRGNLDKGGDLFRATPPDGFEWSGTSGGSGRDEITFRDGDGVSLVFIEAATPDELSLVADWEVVGPTGTGITINDDAIPVMEVVAEGSTAYAIVDLPYLGPLPLLQAGEARGTAIVTSPDEGRPTLDEAVEILETVRVERCAAMAQAFVWASAGGFAPVPSFEPDPLGKTRPDQPQPAIQGLPSISAYSIEQLAYIMPVEAGRSQCAAEAALMTWGEDPIGYIQAVTPSGTFQQEFDAIIADC
jgi:hypothetical protein